MLILSEGGEKMAQVLLSSGSPPSNLACPAGEGCESRH